MVAHADLTDTAVYVAETPPLEPPARIGHVYIENASSSRCVRVGLGTASADDYGLFGFLPLPSAGDPTGILISRCALDIAIDPTSKKLYFSTSSGSSTWELIAAEASSESIAAIVTEEFLVQVLQDAFEPLLYDSSSQGFIFSPGDEGKVWATVDGIAQWVAPGSVLGGGNGNGGSSATFEFAYLDQVDNIYRFDSNYTGDLAATNVFVESLVFPNGTLKANSSGLRYQPSSSTTYDIGFLNKVQIATRTQHRKVSIPTVQNGVATLDTDVSNVFQLLLDENLSISVTGTTFSGSSPQSFKLFVQQLGGNFRGAGNAGEGYSVTFPDFRFPAAPPAPLEYLGDILMVKCDYVLGAWLCTYVQTDPSTVSGEGWNT